jgi:hypothetical protein
VEQILTPDSSDPCSLSLKTKKWVRRDRHTEYGPRVLARLTGFGIYYDSMLLGVPVAASHPLGNAGVMGQDSPVVARFGGKLHWFW